MSDAATRMFAVFALLLAAPALAQEPLPLPPVAAEYATIHTCPTLRTVHRCPYCGGTWATSEPKPGPACVSVWSGVQESHYLVYIVPRGRDQTPGAWAPKAVYLRICPERLIDTMKAQGWEAEP